MLMEAEVEVVDVGEEAVVDSDIVVVVVAAY